MSMFANREKSRWLTAAGVLVVLTYLFPVYWMVVSAFKNNAELFRNPPTLFPVEPTMAAFRWIFERDNVALYLWNSFFIASSTTLLTLILAAPAAYGLSKIRARWVDAALIFILVIQVLPPALLATPMFVIFRQFELINTRLSVVLADTTRTLPFALIILRTQFLMVPNELEEAARIDGCSRVTAFLRIVLPAAFRAEVEHTKLIVSLGDYGELGVWPEAEWDDRAAAKQLAEHDSHGSAKAFREFTKNAHEVKLDGQFRFAVSENLRRRAGFTDTGTSQPLYVIGARNRIEIWERSRHEAFYGEGGK